MVQGERAVIKLASPDIREEDIAAAVAVLRTGNLVQGENVEAFEKSLCRFTGFDHCAVVSSCTAALHLSLKALGIGPGDWVLVPAFTFPATANAVENVGANVILCDVDRGSYVVTPQLVSAAISQNAGKRIKAVIAVHEFGMPAEIGELSEICRQNGLLLLEDAACALGTVACGFQPGHYGTVACYSFHPRKAVTTGEGGAIVTSDEALVKKIRLLRNHGMQKGAVTADFVEAGLNYRMTEFQAALGLGQIERFGREIQKRKTLASIYFDSLAGAAGLTLPQPDNGHSWQSFMVVLDPAVDRGEVIRELLGKGVESNLGAQAINCLAYYREKYGYTELSMPQAARLYKHGLVVPLYGKLSEDQVGFIAAELCAAVQKCLRK
jgi:perosamine synthetase